MKRHSSWNIIHIDVASELPAEIRPDGGAMIVFWQGEVPLGHRWLEPKAFPLTREALLEIAPPRRAESQPSGATPWISLVIPTRERPDFLRRCLGSLEDQTVRPHEVVVVDNTAGDPATRRVAEAFPWVRYVREPVPGLSVARNAGVRHTSGEIIGFIDDDETVHPSWVAAVGGALAEGGCDLVTGLVLPASISSYPQYLFERRFSFIRGYSSWTTNRNDFAPWKLGGGGNMAVRRTWFDRLNGFDVRLGAGRAGCSEDTDFFQRLLDRGGVCRYEPRAVVFHYHREQYDALKRQARAYMRGHVIALAMAWLERGDLDSRRRLLRSVPRHYAASLARALMRPRDLPFGLLLTEIGGCFSALRWLLEEVRSRESVQLEPSTVPSV